jgi:hypothetical protein
VAAEIQRRLGFPAKSGLEHIARSGAIHNLTMSDRPIQDVDEERKIPQEKLIPRFLIGLTSESPKLEIEFKSIHIGSDTASFFQILT